MFSKESLFAISLFPYLGFLWFMTRSGQMPRLALIGFYFLLVFVAVTIPAGIYAQVHYGDQLANIDWLHGRAESFLTISNILVVLGFYQAIAKQQDINTQTDSQLSLANEPHQQEQNLEKYGISAIEPDWSREKYENWWSPSRQLLKAIRNYQKWSDRSGAIAQLLRKKFVLEHRFWSVMTGADIPINCNLGGGLMMPHPTGVVIHPDAIIGPNCMIFQQVTITGIVKIRGHVDIGAGAKILNNVTLGNHVQVGANAVVKNLDAPDESIVVGIPAKIKFPSISF
jgi:serine O-acetyltransferase